MLFLLKRRDEDDCPRGEPLAYVVRAASRAEARVIAAEKSQDEGWSRAGWASCEPLRAVGEDAVLVESVQS
jgi:hypothetical protein